MCCAVSTISSFDTITDKSLRTFMFIFTIVAHVLTAENSNMSSNVHTKSIPDVVVNSSRSATESLLESQSTNIQASVPAVTSFLFRGGRPESFSQLGRSTEIWSQSVQDGALSKESQYSNPKSLTHMLSFRNALNKVISDISTTLNTKTNIITTTTNNNIKAVVIHDVVKPFVRTSSGYHALYSAVSDKQTTSDNGVLSNVQHSASKSQNAALMAFLSTSIQAVTLAFQKIISQILRSFPVHSQVKHKPQLKISPVPLMNDLRRKTKRSNFPGYLPQVSQSSKTAATTPHERINTPPNMPEYPESTRNPPRRSPSLIHLKQSKISFNIQQPAKHNPLNSRSPVEKPDLRNSNPFVNSSQEQNMLSWFGSASAVFRAVPSNTSRENLTSFVHDNETALALVASGGQMPCDDNCSRRQGVCVLGNDFKMHCVVVGDACEQFPCVNGECVATDGLYKCECHGGWVGTFCDTPCTLECGDNGYCGRFVGNDTVACICHWNYTGHRCEDKRTILHGIIEVPVGDGDLQVWQIAVVVTMIVTCLAFIFVLIPYLLWRRQWIPIRKLIFYFQDYEDDDEKEFDAFISYKSTPKDEKFILQHLYPKLEKELHFKLCLHFRDFPPGEPIANNIIRAIEGSRRTILILSPSFVSSEWCRMEYQKAQYEMLKLKHKIIPIILEDISGMPEIDRNLQNIMNTVTYITWPGNEDSVSSKRIAKFWTLLELSMPKRKSEYQSCSDSSCGSVPLTIVDSALSSISEDESPESLSSRDDESVSENSISSIDNTEMSRDLPAGQSNFPSNFLEGLKNSRVSCPIQNSGSSKEIVNVNSRNEEVGKETNTKMSVYQEGVNGTVRHRKTSLSESENCGFVDNMTVDLKENTKGDNDYQGKEQTPIFLSSDDFIVEIRETGLMMNGVRIKARSRQLFV